MSRWPLLMLLALVMLVLTWRGRALQAATASLDTERAALSQVERDLDELARLRARKEIVAATKRPTNDVIAQVNALLRDAGIPTRRLQSLEPEADVALSGRYRSQSIRIALSAMALPEIGALLATWRAAESAWTPRSIELTHAAGDDRGGQDYDVRLVVAATYLADLTSESRP